MEMRNVGIIHHSANGIHDARPNPYMLRLLPVRLWVPAKASFSMMLATPLLRAFGEMVAEMI